MTLPRANGGHWIEPNYIETIVEQNGLDPTTVQQQLNDHVNNTAIHLTTNEKTFVDATDNAKFKKASAAFNNATVTQTFTDAFCTANSLVTVCITSGTPLGTWTVDSQAGQFVITSSTAETASISFDYFIQKAVGA